MVECATIPGEVVTMKPLACCTLTIVTLLGTRPATVDLAPRSAQLLEQLRKPRVERCVWAVSSRVDFAVGTRPDRFDQMITDGKLMVELRTRHEPLIERARTLIKQAVSGNSATRGTPQHVIMKIELIASGDSSPSIVAYLDDEGASSTDGIRYRSPTGPGAYREFWDYMRIIFGASPPGGCARN
jgi:hypothetical protein